MRKKPSRNTPSNSFRQQRDNKLVTCGEAYFDRHVRETRFKELQAEGKEGLRKDWRTTYSPQIKRLAMAYIVEWQEEADLAELDVPQLRDEPVN